MRQFIKSLATISALSLLASAPIFLSANPAKADTGMQGSYVGVGGGSVGGEGYGALGGRVQLGDAPFSIRPTLLYAPDSGEVAFTGTVTYDAPIAENTNLYAGIGAGFARDYSSFALTGGLETAVSQNVVLYGDATYLTESRETAWKVGVGYKF
jgi:hypothetical protein